MILYLLIPWMLYEVYKRCMPYRGPRCTTEICVDNNEIGILDLRDFNESYKDPVPQAKNIPVAYLKRFCNEIEKDRVHIVANCRHDFHIAARFLRKKGIATQSYTLLRPSVDR